mmetsp:Transcript_42111/g.48856  ORF Transcript_42111/g.48856 Transcript_42111/m.48856 type:complete len:596 (+) Transcript_42111:1390-3177(+)
MLMKQLNTEIFEHYGKDFEKLNELLDARYCRLTNEDESRFKYHIEEIFEVKNFLKYYLIVGSDVPDKETLAKRLKTAVKNSAEKKYHGDEKNLNEIPTIDLQSQELIHNKPTLLKYWDEKRQLLDKDTDDAFWKKLCIERFKWIRQRVHHSYDKLTPKDFAEMSDHNRIYGPSKDDDPQREYNKEKFKNPHFDTIQKHKVFHEYAAGFTWLELFAKLDFEEFLDVFPILNNFKYLYDFIHAVKGRIKCLFLKIQSKRLLKSGYYFYMTILSNLTDVESLIISDADGCFANAYKYLVKGVCNYHDNGGSLKKLFLHKVFTCNGFYKIIRNFPDLQAIETYGSTLSSEACKAIGKVLSDNKYMKELDLSSTSYNDQMAKDIADGLMRAKMMEVLKLKNTPGLVNGISPMLYNLAFSPKIRFVDLSGCSVGGNANVIEALYKLIKISGSMEHLVLNNCGNLSNMSHEFFVALGENKTLLSLQMDTSTKYTSDFASKLGKACAMNAKKKGLLNTLSCKGGFDNSTFSYFVSSLYISEQDHEYMYGDSTSANKMSGEDLERKLHCNLIHLNIESSSIPFNGSIHELKRRLKPNWPDLVKI